MSDQEQIFLSYSRNDGEAAGELRRRLVEHGLAVFKDDEGIRSGDLWLSRLQEAVSECVGFVVLVGRDGVEGWVGAETQVALSRHFGPHADAERLPIFPVLIDGTTADALPAFLQLFQATPWNSDKALPVKLVGHIRERTSVPDTTRRFEGCPFVGLDAYRVHQADLFFGRQKDTLDALACFDTRHTTEQPVRWLEINGNSGSGKSSLMNAGLLPLVDHGLLWSRTGFAHWQRIGPMMPGEHPVEMLIEQLARTFDEEMTDVRQRIAADERGLADWLRSRKQDDTAYLLAIDQFEEFFTFANLQERSQFDLLLASALQDPDCPLFLVTTVRADFLDRFEHLPRLATLRSTRAKLWPIPPMSSAGLREVIDGPARLAGINVGEVRELMVDQARDEPGALPLVENALYWLWEKRRNNHLSGSVFNEQGGLAGILSQSADDLLESLGSQRGLALELLFRLVKVDPQGQRHTRRRLPLAEAVAVAGGGDRGRDVINRLAGQRALAGGKNGPLRLITVTDEITTDAGTKARERWVNLIHETLIRARAPDTVGAETKPYWPTLWHYIEQHKHRAARRERLQLQAREWQARTGFSRQFGLAGLSGLVDFKALAVPGTLEQRYLRWSFYKSAVQVAILLALTSIIGEVVYVSGKYRMPIEAAASRWAYRLGNPVPMPTLVEIPAGEFMMGRDNGIDESPAHPVTFSAPFHLGATEVTFEQYDAYCIVNGCKWLQDNDFGRQEQPVINVSFSEAQSYAAWLGERLNASCRLPSEAEWEYAASAGSPSEYWWGDNPAQDGEIMMNALDSRSRWSGVTTAPVRKFQANPFGLHDMHGNVWEWVEDCWHTSYDAAPNDGAAWGEENDGACGFRVVRGGSWGGDSQYARSAYRHRSGPDYRGYGLGFRVLCSSPILDSDH